MKIIATEEEFLTRITKNWSKYGGWNWRRLVRLDPCCYCGKKIKPSKFTLEHVIPLSHGGSNRWENKVACCCGCNVHRGNKGLLRHLINPGKAIQNFWNQVKGPFSRD